MDQVYIVAAGAIVTLIFVAGIAVIVSIAAVVKSHEEIQEAEQKEK